MQHRISLKHPRRINGKERSLYSCCGTSTGWYCLCKSLRKADIRELGIGMSIYFKFLKYMMCVFFFLTVLSIPTVILFYNANPHNEDFEFLPLNRKISTLSLGNIG